MLKNAKTSPLGILGLIHPKTPANTNYDKKMSAMMHILPLHLVHLFCLSGDSRPIVTHTGRVNAD